jgi:hypothetical protein
MSFIYERCYCRRCKHYHQDLVDPNVPVPSGRVYRPQVCDRCFLATMGAEQRAQYARWKAAARVSQPQSDPAQQRELFP